MTRRRRNKTKEHRARRELISDFLSAANIQRMDVFKEALAGFMEGSLESELDDELG